MKLEPLKQWICDRCGQVVKSAEEGMVEWVLEKDETVLCYRAYGFHIIHHETSSPSGNCSMYRNHPKRADMHLHEFVGPKGLVLLCQFLDPSPGLDYKGAEVGDIREWLELVRRVQLPGGEDGRDLGLPVLGRHLRRVVSAQHGSVSGSERDRPSRLLYILAGESPEMSPRSTGGPRQSGKRGRRPTTEL